MMKGYSHNKSSKGKGAPKKYYRKSNDAQSSGGKGTSKKLTPKNYC